jgi:hypothetical protein
VRRLRALIRYLPRPGRDSAGAAWLILIRAAPRGSRRRTGAETVK